MGQVKRIGFVFFSFLASLAAGGIIYYFWWPIASWYFNHRPILGVDFYNTASYVSYFLENFTLRINGWRSVWYAGNPLYQDYPTLYFHSIVPLAKIFGVTQGVQLFVLGASFLFVFFAYLSFQELSKSKILSVILSVGVTYSIGFYGALVWGGSLPYFISQTFFAATVYFIIKYLKDGNKKYLSGAALLTAISVFGHPQVAITFIFPTAAILLCFWPKEILPFFSRRKFFDFFRFLGMVLIIVYPRTIYEKAGLDPREQLSFFSQFLSILFERFFSTINFFFPQSGQKETLATSIPTSLSPSSNLAIQEWQRGQINHFIDWTNPIFFVLLGIILFAYLITFFFRSKKRAILNVFPLFLVVTYVLFYVVIYGFGIDIFHGGWYRVFWAVPLVLGFLIAWLWGDLVHFWQGKFSYQNYILKIISLLPLGLVLLISVFVFWRYNPTFIAKFDQKWSAISQTSSAYPNVINLAVGKKEHQELKKLLVPTWLDPSSKNYRLLESDAQVNIWWNSFFDMPMVRGYIDPSSGIDWFYWFNSAVFAQGSDLSQLVNNWHYPEQVALNNALFLLDWYGAKYLEADHASDVNPQITKALLTPQFIKQEGEVFFAKEKGLINLKLSEKDVQAPIKAVNYPQLLFIGSLGTYQKLVDVILSSGSVQFIPISKGEELDLITKLDLKQFEAIFLYDYGYREAASDRSKYFKIWEILADYVKAGGQLFIDSGRGGDSSTRDNRQAYTTQRFYDSSKPLGSQYYDAGVEPTLPEPFPVTRTVYQKSEPGLISSEKQPLLEGVKLDQLVTGEEGEKISLSSEGLRSESKVIAAYQDRPILVERDLGEGKVVWSGLGFLKSQDKSKVESERLLRNILTLFATNEQPKPSFFAETQNFGREVKVSGNSARGILLTKLGDHEGWQALGKDGQSLEVLSLRGTEESSVYIPLAGSSKEDFEVKLVNKNVQKLHYYELNDSLVSPLLLATNAPVVGIVGKQADFEVIIRALAMNNLNSGKIIPLNLGPFLDDLTSSELADLDALILYGYDYRNHDKVWKVIDKYVKEGGKVFVETGQEVKETDSVNLPFRFPKTLPDIFPIEKTRKDTLGKEWSLDQFSPPVLDDQPWKFSLPVEGSGLRPETKVILETEGKPLIAERTYGQGKVIWSGMNLFYHLVYYNNLEEGKFLDNLLSKLVELKDQELPQFSAQRPSGGKATLEGQGAKGVLFKERLYSGWKTRMSSSKRETGLKIYKAGPTYPGFMYVKIPSSVNNSSFKVTFTFQGTLSGYFASLLSLLGFAAVFDYTFFGGRFLVRRGKKAWLLIRKRGGRWWDKEDE